MGSVWDYYKCPLCGRVGNGGYDVDGLDIGPICTGDQAMKSCLDLITDDKLEPRQILTTALEKIVGIRFCQKYPIMASLVVPFIRNCNVHSQQADAWSLRLTSMGGENLCLTEVQPTMLGNALHEMIAYKLRILPSTFLLLLGSTPLEANISLHDQDANDNALITILELDEPVKHDGILQCDRCTFQRFCHYGYSLIGDEPECVIALCEPRGGRRADISEGY